MDNTTAVQAQQQQPPHQHQYQQQQISSRISHGELVCVLEKLHQELRSQTREASHTHSGGSKGAEHQRHVLLRRAFGCLTSAIHIKTADIRPDVVHRLIQELYAILVGGGGDGFAPPRVRVLCCALVRELYPGDVPAFFKENFRGNFACYDLSNLHYFLPLIAELSKPPLLIQNIESVVGWVLQKGAGDDHHAAYASPGARNDSLQRAAFSPLMAVCERHPLQLSYHRHIRPVEDLFADMLTNASTSTTKTSATSILGVRLLATKSVSPVTEIDGTPSRDFFTCLNVAEEYTADQINNTQVFSLLYSWLFHLYQHQLLDSRRRQTREEVLSKLAHFGLVDAQSTPRTHVSRTSSPTIRHVGPSSGLSSPTPTATPSSLRRTPSHTREGASDLCDSDGDGGESSTYSSTDDGAGAGAAAAAGPREGGGMFRLDDRFREVIVSYCLRVLSQVERETAMDPCPPPSLVRHSPHRVSLNHHTWTREFAECCAMESVRILDLLCLMQPEIVSRIFPAVKKVYERTADRQGGLVFTAVLQFFLNHSQHVIFDIEPVLHHFFAGYVSVHYRRHLLAMSALLFLTTNTSKLLLNTTIFTKYFPAILKLVAYHPRTVAAEVLPILPAMVGPTTFVELFHTLLDLPLTAALMEQHDRISTTVDVSTSGSASGPGVAAAAGGGAGAGAERGCATFRAVQRYILRNEQCSSSAPAAAAGETVCVWEDGTDAQRSMIHLLWNCLPLSPRVSYVCKLVPKYLRVYFEVVLLDGPRQCIERLVPLLLSRFSALYPVDFFLQAAHRCMIDTLLAIFQQWPSFLISLKSPIVKAIPIHLDAQGVLLVMHLCWIIGEYASPTLTVPLPPDNPPHQQQQQQQREQLCDAQAVGEFFEALEALAYESMAMAVGACKPQLEQQYHPQQQQRQQWQQYQQPFPGPSDTAPFPTGLSQQQYQQQYQQASPPPPLSGFWGGVAAFHNSATSLGRAMRIGTHHGHTHEGDHPQQPQPVERVRARESAGPGPAAADESVPHPHQQHQQEHPQGLTARDVCGGRGAGEDDGSDSSGGSGGGGSDDYDSSWADANGDPSRAVFVPKFVAVCVASMTKLGLKFPEYSPRVVLCFSKMLRHFDIPEWLMVKDRILDSLQLFHCPAIASGVLTAPHTRTQQPAELSAHTPLSHTAHSTGPDTCTSGPRLHTFELPLQPPLTAHAADFPESLFRQDETHEAPEGLPVGANGGAGAGGVVSGFVLQQQQQQGRQL